MLILIFLSPIAHSSAAPPPAAAGDNWAAAVAVPPGEHAFKLVIVKQDGSTYWEQGGDRSLTVAAAGPAAASGTPALRATCRFDDTAAIEVEGPAAKPAAAAAVQVGRGWRLALGLRLWEFCGLLRCMLHGLPC